MVADLGSACGDDPSALCRWVFDRTSNEMTAKISEWVVGLPLRILAIAIVAAVVARVVSKAITRFADSLIAGQPDPDEEEDDDNMFERGVDRLRNLGEQQLRARQRAVTLGAVLRSLSRAAIWFTAGLLILGELSINLAPLIAGAGIAGVAIGFGAQSLVKDFLAGIFILIEDQYGVGDIVDVGPATGVIEAVTLRTTRLRDASGVLWVVPNGEIQRVGNMSQLWSKSLLDIEVAYDTDVDHASAVIKNVLDEMWHEHRSDATIIEEPEVLGLEAFGADAMVIRAVVKTEPSEQFKVARQVRSRLKKAFDEAGIEIPFPQRTVWFRSENGEGEPPTE